MWIGPLKDKKDVTTSNAFQKFLDESGYKPNKLWVDWGSGIYNRSKKLWLHKNNFEIIQHILKEYLLFQTI